MSLQLNPFTAHRSPKAAGEELYFEAESHLTERLSKADRGPIALQLVRKAIADLPSFRDEDMEAIMPRFRASVAATNEALHEKLDRIGFGRDGITKAADSLSGFKVTWLDCFGIHETYVVPVEALRAYCAAANDPVPSDLELQTVIKSVPRPSRMGSTADWVRAAVKKLDDDRKDARRLTW
jgi:hypothetical protein